MRDLFLLWHHDDSGGGQAAGVEEAAASHACGILKTSCLGESVAPGSHFKRTSLPIELHAACQCDGFGLTGPNVAAEQGLP